MINKAYFVLALPCALGIELDATRTAAAGGNFVDAQEQGKQLAQIVIEEDLDLRDVWLRYFGMAGTASEEEFVLYAVGEFQLDQMQRDLISLAVHELVTQYRETSEDGGTPQRQRRLSDHGE